MCLNQASVLTERQNWTVLPPLTFSSLAEHTKYNISGESASILYRYIYRSSYEVGSNVERSSWSVQKVQEMERTKID